MRRERHLAQISANVSPDTRDHLERYVRARGLKKGFVLEGGLLDRPEPTPLFVPLSAIPVLSIK